jgi:hypothetical protein
MEVNRLTDIEVKKAKAKDKPYAMSDGAGLYLWVTTAGGKLWRWGYRFDGREKLMSYGKYPDVTILMAREAHHAADRSQRRKIARGQMSASPFGSPHPRG